MAVDDSDIDELVELITERVRGRLAKDLNVLPSDSSPKSPCEDDSDADCATCGACVTRRPWSVRAIESAGASRICAPPGTGSVPQDVARLIDHTLLKPEAKRDDIVTLCQEARKYNFASVCVNSTWVSLAKSLLSGSDVMVCCVVGFPLGAMSPGSKAYEAREAVRHGANEIDMVMNVGAMKSRDYATVYEDISRVVKAAHPAGVKVILETSSLTDEEKIIGCALSKLAGAAFVKTSTGFAKGGATVEDVALMRRVVGSEMGVKASGGVRTKEDAERMTKAGANRIGASASIAIATGDGSTKKSSGY